MWHFVVVSCVWHRPECPHTTDCVRQKEEMLWFAVTRPDSCHLLKADPAVTPIILTPRTGPIVRRG